MVTIPCDELYSEVYAYMGCGREEKGLCNLDGVETRGGSEEIRPQNCRVSKGKEEGLVVLETLREESILYLKNEKNSGYKVMATVDKQEPDHGKAL